MSRKFIAGKYTRARASPYRPTLSSAGGMGGVRLECFGPKELALAMVSFPAFDFLPAGLKVWAQYVQD